MSNISSFSHSDTAESVDLKLWLFYFYPTAHFRNPNPLRCPSSTGSEEQGGQEKRSDSWILTPQPRLPENPTWLGLTPNINTPQWSLWMLLPPPALKPRWIPPSGLLKPKLQDHQLQQEVGWLVAQCKKPATRCSPAGELQFPLGNTSISRPNFTPAPSDVSWPPPHRHNCSPIS